MPRPRTPPLTLLPCLVLASLVGTASSRAQTPAASPAPSPAAAHATTHSPIAGSWDAAVTYGAVEVPFRFGIAQHGDRVSGWFYNGDERVVSESGSFNGAQLRLEFPAYGRRLEAQLAADGTLSGSYGPASAGSSLRVYPFTARRAARAAAATAAVKANLAAGPGANAPVPSIAGLWIVPTDSDKAGEKAWRFIAWQSGSEVRASILRVDGDSGVLNGRWQDGRLVLSHFDGARPLRIELTAQPDGSLQILLRNSSGTDHALSAWRPADARARGLPDAADPAQHTRLRNPDEPLAFSFPDLEGHLISNTDARFRGKVLVIDVAGSWCPNCHDEAPFLESLYRKYHRRGLEIVTLSFEEPEQYANPTRLRAFVREFGLDYTVLLAGPLEELHTRLPQAVDLDAYPTTFFVGRDGRVRSVHAGFAAAATGPFNARLKQDFTATIEGLLAERGPAAAGS